MSISELVDVGRALFYININIFFYSIYIYRLVSLRAGPTFWDYDPSVCSAGYGFLEA